MARSLFYQLSGDKGRVGSECEAATTLAGAPPPALAEACSGRYGAPMPEPIPFDALLFDLDGTLLATDRFWIPAARVGARRAFAELGLERELPTAQQWMALVGLPLDQGFAELFADLEPEARELVQARCVEEEHFALAAGQAALLPGVRDVLEELRALGVPMGIASNCSQAYLDAAMNDMGLREYIQEGRCLQSPGIRTKADMIEDLLLTFGTRSAVMVGDRRGDCEAAHANALPHVHLLGGFAPAGELVEAEAEIRDFLELLPRLRGRARWIESALVQLGFGGAGGPRSLGVTGRSGSGKSLFARDAAALLRAAGREVALLSLDEFLRPDAPSLGGEAAHGLAPHEHLARAFDVDALCEGVLEPFGAGRGVSLERRDHSGATQRVELGPEGTLVLEGLFLLHPRLRAQLDRVAYLDVPEELCLKRVAARELPLGGQEELDRTRRLYLPAQAEFEADFPPAARADLLLEASNTLGPA